MLANYTFFQVLWWMIILFFWIIWFWLLIGVFADVFRRHDISGWGKTLWLIFVIIFPFLGVFVYLISQHDGMTQRTIDRDQAQRAQVDQYVRETAGSGSPTAEIERAKKLLDSGAISQAEYDAIKQKALAAA